MVFVGFRVYPRNIPKSATTIESADEVASNSRHIKFLVGSRDYVDHYIPRLTGDLEN